MLQVKLFLYGRERNLCAIFPIIEVCYNCQQSHAVLGYL